MKLYPDMELFKTNELKLGLEPKITNRKNKSIYLSTKKKSSGKGRRTKTVSSHSNNSISKKRQEVFVNTSYRIGKDLHTKNLQYIQKEGKGREGENPQVYGSTSLEEYQKNLNEKSWRIILAPGTNKVNLEVFTKEFIKRLERFTNYKFEWLAANHYDTTHHHTHVIIQGKDMDGKDIKFAKGTVRKIMRETARDLCTSLVGYQTNDDIAERKREQIKSNRFTGLDITLEKYIKDGILTKDYMKNKDQDFLTNRLDYLKELGLIEYSKKNQSFKFNENWKDELKILGKYNTFYEGFNYANCEPEKYNLHEMKQNEKIEGTVLKKFIRQKDSNNFAIVLKKNDGTVSYVPINFYPKDIKTGDEITIQKLDKKTFINKHNR